MRVLKFGAIWCKECIVMRPMWQEIEESTPELKTEYYDADNDSAILEKYQVKDVPEFIFLDKNDNEIIRLKGAQNKEDLIKLVKENFNK
ncbi:MAG: thioredoxin family protein [Patescibacteria group bacterium]